MAASLNVDGDWHTITVQIPFASPAHARIAQQTIDVDAERQPHAVRRTLAVQNELVCATFSTLTLRLARITLNAFLENVDLIIRTLEEFGDEASGAEPHEQRRVSERI